MYKSEVHKMQFLNVVNMETSKSDLLRLEMKDKINRIENHPYIFIILQIIKYFKLLYK